MWNVKWPKNECMNEEGKFWGVTAAPIQSSANPSRMKANSLSDKRGELWLNTKDRPKICSPRTPQKRGNTPCCLFFFRSSSLIWSFDPLAEPILNFVLWLDINFDPRAGYDFDLLARSSSIFWLDLLRFDSLAESISFDSLAESTSIFWLDLNCCDFRSSG